MIKQSLTSSCPDDAVLPSPRSRLARRLTVAAMFRLDPRSKFRPPLLQTASAAAAASLQHAIPPGGIALVTGPSGAGKSSILRQLTRQLLLRESRVVLVQPPSNFLHEPRPPLDLLRGSLTADIRLLCQCGLAEAPLWLRPARALSEGQRWRLALAIALATARNSRATTACIVADEFASTLDRVTARTLAMSIRREWKSLQGCRLVVASAHDDLEHWLAPDVTLHVDAAFVLHARFSLSRRGDAA